MKIDDNAIAYRHMTIFAWPFLRPGDNARAIWWGWEREGETGEQVGAPRRRVLELVGPKSRRVFKLWRLRGESW